MRPEWHIEAVALRALGFPVVKIAAKFGVTRSGVYGALTNATKERKPPVDKREYRREWRRKRLARLQEAAQ